MPAGMLTPLLFNSYATTRSACDAVQWSSLKTIVNLLSAVSEIPRTVPTAAYLSVFIDSVKLIVCSLSGEIVTLDMLYESKISTG